MRDGEALHANYPFVGGFEPDGGFGLCAGGGASGFGVIGRSFTLPWMVFEKLGRLDTDVPSHTAGNS